MADCDNKCESCALSGNCSDEKKKNALSKLPQNEGSNIKKVIGVVSGKGGVGKSSVTSMLAAASRRHGLMTSVMDADITGPSIPKALGITEKATGIGDIIYPQTSKNGIKAMSINLLLDNDTDPVVWRGPILGGVVEQFWSDVYWGTTDVMYVDMPPGTGDIVLTAYQKLPIDGIVIVASPQQLVEMIVEKSVKMAGMLNIPIVGLVENMSYYKCPDCGAEHKIFGESNIEEVAKKYNIENVVKLPIDPAIAAACDNGTIEDYDGPAAQALDKFAELAENFVKPEGDLN